MRAPISLKTLYLSYVGQVASQYIALPGTLPFTFPMHDTASTYRT